VHAEPALKERGGPAAYPVGDRGDDAEAQEMQGEIPPAAAQEGPEAVALGEARNRLGGGRRGGGARLPRDQEDERRQQDARRPEDQEHQLPGLYVPRDRQRHAANPHRPIHQPSADGLRDRRGQGGAGPEDAER
jgi:hypothetical protein